MAEQEDAIHSFKYTTVVQAVTKDRKKVAHGAAARSVKPGAKKDVETSLTKSAGVCDAVERPPRKCQRAYAEHTRYVLRVIVMHV